jgi:hypothetical protein
MFKRQDIWVEREDPVVALQVLDREAGGVFGGV